MTKTRAASGSRDRPMDRGFRRFGPVVAVTLASQAVSAGALLLLPFVNPDVSDAYAIGIQTGNGANAAIVLGVTYMLAIGRPGFKYWRSASLAAVAFSPIMGIITAALLLLQPTASHSNLGLRLGLIGIFSLGGMFLALGGTRGVYLACCGRPLALAGITIVPNVGLLLGVLILAAWRDASESLFLVPAILWVGCTLITLLLVIRQPSSEPEVISHTYEDRRGNTLAHLTALIVGAIAGSVFPTVLIVATAQLPAGTTTLLFLITRVGTSLIGLGINSVLLVRYNWLSEAKGLGQAPRWLLTITIVFGIGGISAHWYANSTLSYWLVGISWVAALASGPIVSREMNARRMGRTLLWKVLADLVISAACACFLWRDATATGYLAAFMASQCLSVLFAAIALRDRRLALLAWPCIALSLVLVVFGW